MPSNKLPRTKNRKRQMQQNTNPNAGLLPEQEQELPDKIPLALLNRKLLSQGTVQRLQRTIGNQAVIRLLRKRASSKTSIKPKRNQAEIGTDGATPMNIAGRVIVQRAPQGYQTEMREGGSALTADTRAEKAASSATVAEHGVSKEYDKPGIGLLSEKPIPTDYARKRQKQFRDAAKNLNRGNFPGYYGDLKDTHAYKSLMTKVARYAHDETLIDEAERDYNLFAPLASLAARSVLKLRALHGELGFTSEDDIAAELSPKELTALKAAGKEVQTEINSVRKTGADLEGERQTFVGASQAYAASLKGKFMNTLSDELTKAEADWSKIMSTIKKVAKFASYVEKGATLVAGGATKLGKLTAPVSATEGGLKGAGEKIGKVGKGAGTLGKVAVMGMKLYYADELEKIKMEMNTLRGHIKAVGAEKAALELKSIHNTYDGKAKEYRSAVERFVTAINKRREQMAIFGAKADKIMSKRGKSQNISQTMLYASSVMESKPIIDTAKTAGTTAKESLLTADNHIGEHRGPYSRHDDAFYYQGSWDYGTHDKHEGPDKKIIYSLHRQVTNWMNGADEELTLLEGQIGSPSHEDPKTNEKKEATGIWKLLELVGITDY